MKDTCRSSVRTLPIESHLHRLSAPRLGIVPWPQRGLDSFVTAFPFRLQVRVALNNKYKEAELAALSDWHTTDPGEKTVTPQIRDVSDVPQVSRADTVGR